MADVNRRYFESLLEAKDLSLRGLAQRMNMAHSQLSLTFSGHRKLQLDEAAQLARIFGEPLHRIVEAAGVSVSGTGNRRVSVIGALRGDGTVLLHPEGVIERTSAPEDVPEDGIAIQARTAGSPLDYMDGFVFFCQPLRGVDTAILGRYCLVKIKDGPMVIAGVRRGYLPNTFNLIGTVSRESATLEMASPVVWVRT